MVLGSRPLGMPGSRRPADCADSAIPLTCVCCSFAASDWNSLRQPWIARISRPVLWGRCARIRDRPGPPYGTHARHPSARASGCPSSSSAPGFSRPSSRPSRPRRSRGECSMAGGWAPDLSSAPLSSRRPRPDGLGLAASPQARHRWNRATALDGSVGMCTAGATGGELTATIAAANASGTSRLPSGSSTGGSGALSQGQEATSPTWRGRARACEAGRRPHSHDSTEGETPAWRALLREVWVGGNRRAARG